MLQAETKEQEEFVLGKIYGNAEITNDGKTLYVEMDDDYYAYEIDFDTMAEIVDYLRSVNKSKKEAIDLSIVTPEMQDVVDMWLKYKREKHQSYKPTGFKTFYKNLCKYSNNDPKIAMQIVEHSMQNNYAGIFPPRNNNSNYGRPKTNTEKFYDTIKSANEFSQRLHESVGNEQAEMGDGDNEPLW